MTGTSVTTEDTRQPADQRTELIERNLANIRKLAHPHLGRVGQHVVREIAEEDAAELARIDEVARKQARVNAARLQRQANVPAPREAGT